MRQNGLSLSVLLDSLVFFSISLHPSLSLLSSFFEIYLHTCKVDCNFLTMNNDYLIEFTLYLFENKSFKSGTITDSRQTNTMHDKPQTDKHQTRQTLDMIYIRHKQHFYVQGLLFIMLIMSRVFRVQCLPIQGLSCLVFVCLGSVMAP